MTSDTTRPPDKRYHYRNAIDGLIKLCREEGPKGLARGVSTNTVRLSQFNSRTKPEKLSLDKSSLDERAKNLLLHCTLSDIADSGFSSRVVSHNHFLSAPFTTWHPIRYDFFKSTLLQNPIPYIDFQFRDNLLLHTVASCAAGTVATSESWLYKYPGFYIVNANYSCMCAGRRFEVPRYVCCMHHSLVLWFLCWPQFFSLGQLVLSISWRLPFVRMAPGFCSKAGLLLSFA